LLTIVEFFMFEGAGTEIGMPPDGWLIYAPNTCPSAHNNSTKQ